MNAYEKKISFLNRYFVYKKIRNVHAEKIEIDLEDIQEYEKKLDKKETKVAVKQLKKKSSPKIKKINKKIMLVPATETKDVETLENVETFENVETLKEPVKELVIVKENVKPTIVIEEDNDEEALENIVKE